MNIQFDQSRTSLRALAAGLLMVTAFFSSCLDMEEANTDKDSATKEQLLRDFNIVGGFFPGMQMDIIPASEVDGNPYQRAQNLAGDIYSGYMAAIGNWNGSSNNSTYYLSFGRWNDVGFTVAYEKVMSPWLNIKKKSDEYDLPEAEAVATILKVAAMHRITDNHGPIPYKSFGSGDLVVPYDAQETVYNCFFEELNESVAVLEDFVSKSPGAKPLERFDLIYGGDLEKWIKYANSLKLRLAMRIVYANPERARKYAEEAVNHPFGVIQNNDENAEVKTANGVVVSNPLNVIWAEYKDTRMGASMESFLKGYKDKRLTRYFLPSTLKEGEYYGVRNGAHIFDKSRFEKASTPNVSANTLDDPIRLMVAAEMYFLRAEGAIRGWNMAGKEGLSSAGDLYRRGVETSFAQLGMAGAAAPYLEDETSKPADFIDHIGVGSIKARTDLTIKWTESDPFERKLERIITQKWLAMFPEGQEAWSEFRRTGYPRIFPVMENRSQGLIHTDKQIRRIPFPESEYYGNEEEVSKAVQLLGGPDNGGTPVWWDKKPN